MPRKPLDLDQGQSGRNKGSKGRMNGRLRKRIQPFLGIFGSFFVMGSLQVTERRSERKEMIGN